MTINKDDFLRPFTEEEFKNAFKEAGFDQKSFQYIKEEMHAKRDECLDEIKEYIYSTSEDSIKNLLEEYSEWGSVREETWKLVLEQSDVSTYLEQRELGHGHEWAMLYSFFGPNTDSLGYTYEQMLEKDPTQAEKEKGILIQNLSHNKGEVYKEFLRSALPLDGYHSFKEALEISNYFIENYNSLIEKGFSEEYAYGLAEILAESEESYCDDLEEYHKIYAEVYEKVMQKGKARWEARYLADKCSDIFINFPEIDEVKKLNDAWERELYWEYLIKDLERMNGSYKRDVDLQTKNYYRKELNLPPLETPINE